jgi:hypothetical protein
MFVTKRSLKAQTWWYGLCLVAFTLALLIGCGGGGGGGISGGTPGTSSGRVSFTATVTSPAGTRTFNANFVEVGLGVDYIGVAGGIVGDIGVAFVFRRPSQIPATIILDRDAWLEDYNQEARVVFVVGGAAEEFTTRVEGGSATIRITSLTYNRIAGTFQIIAKSATTDTFVTASGSFDVPKGTWKFVNVQWVGGPQ